MASQILRFMHDQKQKIDYLENEPWFFFQIKKIKNYILITSL